jgi:hypothetical protein
MQHVLRWHLFLKDYNVHLQYVKGETNSLADALSRLPFDERQNPHDSPVPSVFVHKPELADAKTMHKGSSLQEWADEELGSAHTAANDPLACNKGSIACLLFNSNR